MFLKIKEIVHTINNIRFIYEEWALSRELKELNPHIYKYGTIFYGEPSKRAKEWVELQRMRLYGDALEGKCTPIETYLIEQKNDSTNITIPEKD